MMDRVVLFIAVVFVILAIVTVAARAEEGFDLQIVSVAPCTDCPTPPEGFDFVFLVRDTKNDTVKCGDLNFYDDGLFTGCMKPVADR